MNDHDEYWDSEHKATEEFLKLCPQPVQSHVERQVYQFLNSDPNLPFTPQDKDLWDRFIISNPILRRVINYTYSPPDQIEVRGQMFVAWPSDPDHPILKDSGFIEDTSFIHYVANYPELKNNTLLKNFLSTLQDNARRAMSADIRKLAGAKGSIEELRQNTYHIEYDKNGKQIKATLDQSPYYRIEHLLQERELHHYVLDDNPEAIKDLFLSADKDLMLWMQWFEDNKELQESAYSDETWFYIHDKNGKLVKAPKGHRNPYPSALEPKYRNLRSKTNRQYQLERKEYREWEPRAEEDEHRERLEKNFPRGEIRTDYQWDLEQIFKKAILEWDGNVPPPAYFENALEWGFLNLEKAFKERFIKREELGSEIFKKDDSKYILRDDLDFSGGSLNEPVKDKDGIIIGEKIDFVEEQNQDLVLKIDISHFMDKLSHPVDKIIFLDLWEACKSRDSTCSSDAKLARQLQAEGNSFTPQYVGKRRKKVIADLEETFKAYRE